MGGGVRFPIARWRRGGRGGLGSGRPGCGEAGGGEVNLPDPTPLVAGLLGP